MDTETPTKDTVVDMGQPGSNLPYVVAVIIMMVIGVSGSIILTLLNKSQDNTVLIAAIFGFLTPTTLSLLAFMKSQETHLSVNSRLDEFMKATRSSAMAEGRIQGQDEANARTDALKK